NKIYVPNAGSQNLSVISGSSNMVITTVPMGNIPRGIVYNPQSNRVYVSNYGSDNVIVIDGASDQIVTTIAVGDGPTALFHNPFGNKIYCSNVGAPGPNTPEECTISVIDATSNTVIKSITAGDEPTAFCYSTANNKVYWVDEWSHRVAVADAASDSIISLISLGSSLVQPVDICYNPVNERVYTANRLTYDITVIKDSLPITTGLFKFNYESAVSIHIYPNPTADYCIIKADQRAMGKRYRLVGVAGQTILAGILWTGTQYLDLSAVPSGTYYLTIDGESRSPAVIKQ
ncbi:MAG: YncE family protein, partial [Bacteroidota bacterium]